MILSKVPNELQKSILSILLDKYNKSKTFKGDNKVRQNFYIKPEAVFPDYNDDFADAALIEEFDEDVEELERAGLVSIVKRGRVIERIYMVLENEPLYHKLIGAADKRDELKRSEDILSGFMGRNSTLDKICAAQLERVRSCKKPDIAQDNKRLEQILRCLDFILGNRLEILEREMSIELFGDSKLFEKELKNKVCSVLDSYCEIDETESDGFSDDEKSLKREKLLSHFMIVKNPTYFYFKGNGQIDFSDGTKIGLSFSCPIALRSDSIDEIASVTVSCGTIMTIENLTSFNRVSSENMFCLFLSGYNNSCKSRFLKKIFENNPQKEWYHFGDIDPDGFLILHNLRIKTGIDFKPYRMGIPELVEFKKYCKPLEKNDIAKANSLLERRLFDELARFMLGHNCKLEQEIISWKIGRAW